LYQFFKNLIYDRRVRFALSSLVSGLWSDSDYGLPPNIKRRRGGQLRKQHCQLRKLAKALGFKFHQGKTLLTNLL